MPTRTRSRTPDPPRQGRRIVLSAMGLEGAGKTAMALTAPKPLLVCSIDPNTVDVIEKEFDSPVGDIDPAVLRYVACPYPMVGFETNEDEVASAAADSWNILTETLREVIEGKAEVMPRTVVLDTGTELSSLNILAEFGRTDKISPAVRRIKMGNVNARFAGLFRGLEHAGVHVVITHRVREIWETYVDEVRGSRTYGEEKERVVPGEYQRVNSYKHMGNLCNVEALLAFDPKREGRLSGKFGIKVVRSMIRPALVNQEWWGKEDGVRCASFPFLAVQLYPQTSIEDWS